MRRADYGPYKSRHDFTRQQLMSCLILKALKRMTGSARTDANLTKEAAFRVLAYAIHR